MFLSTYLFGLRSAYDPNLYNTQEECLSEFEKIIEYCDHKDNLNGISHPSIQDIVETCKQIKRILCQVVKLNHEGELYIGVDTAKISQDGLYILIKKFWSNGSYLNTTKDHHPEMEALIEVEIYTKSKDEVIDDLITENNRLKELVSMLMNQHK